jgi:hypothetical protein
MLNGLLIIYVTSEIGTNLTHNLWDIVDRSDSFN